MRGLFSTLGYAPSPAEAARFVKELFPNEVSVGAVGGPVPFAEPFTLEPVEGAAVTSDIPAALDERAPYTSSQFPAVDPPEGPPATTEPEAPVAAVTVPPPKVKAKVKDTAEAPVGDASDEWVAPPGAMPDAPRLTRRGGGAKREGEESSELSLAASKRIREFVEVSPGSATHDEGPEDDGYVFAEPAPQQPHTSLDWHTPPEPPREKPKPKTVGLTVWVLAAAICAAVAAFFYVAVGHKLGGHRSPIGTEAVGEPPDPSTLKPTPLEGSLRPPEPEKPPAPPPADPKAPPTLVISADRPAQIFIDGQEMKFTTPATLRKLSPGAHTITLESDGMMREKRVVLKAGETEKVHVTFAGKKPKGEKR